MSSYLRWRRQRLSGTDLAHFAGDWRRTLGRSVSMTSMDRLDVELARKRKPMQSVKGKPRKTDAVVPVSMV
jgi:hypothetical protein